MRLRGGKNWTPIFQAYLTPKEAKKTIKSFNLLKTFNFRHFSDTTHQTTFSYGLLSNFLNFTRLSVLFCQTFQINSTHFLQFFFYYTPYLPHLRLIPPYFCPNFSRICSKFLSVWLHYNQKIWPELVAQFSPRFRSLCNECSKLLLEFLSYFVKLFDLIQPVFL